MLAKAGLHRRIVGEKLGDDVARCVQLLEELELIVGQREHDREALPTLGDELFEPRLDLSAPRRQVGPKHRHETALRLREVAVHVVGRDAPPVLAVDRAVDDEPEPQPRRIQVGRRQQSMRVEDIRFALRAVKAASFPAAISCGSTTATGAALNDPSRTHSAILGAQSGVRSKKLTSSSRLPEAPVEAA